MNNTALFILISLIWGSTFYAITFQLGEVAKEWSLFYRFLIATILLFLFAHFTKRRLKFELDDHKIFIGLGIFIFSLNYYLTYWGTEYLTSGLVAVVFSSITLMNILNAAWILKRPFEPLVLAASLVGMFGVLLLFLPEIERFNLKDESVFGLGIMLIAVYSASLGNTIAATKKAKALPVIPTNAWGMFYGTVFLAAFAIFTGKPIGFEVTFSYIASLSYLAVIGTVVAFTSYLVLIDNIGPERAGFFSIVTPVVALTLSTLFENYHWTTEGIVGMVLALSGNYFVLKKKQENAVAN
jgi:drug/metabolite transporter (DMT)-like permease